MYKLVIYYFIVSFSKRRDSSKEKRAREGLTILVFYLLLSLQPRLLFINKDSVTGDDLPIDLSYFSSIIKESLFQPSFTNPTIKTFLRFEDVNR